jgi:hypothetical protein
MGWPIFLYLQTKKGEQWKRRDTSVLPSTSAKFSRVLMTDEKLVVSVGKFCCCIFGFYASDNTGRESQWIGPLERWSPMNVTDQFKTGQWLSNQNQPLLWLVTGLR